MARRLGKAERSSHGRSNGEGQAHGLTMQDERVALYMRVSSEDQAERGTIEAQRDFLRQFTKLYQLTIAGEYADDGATGTIALGARPEGYRMIQDAEAGRFGCVLVTRVDRLGRTLDALLDAHKVLSKASITIRSATEPFDTSTPIGTFLFQLLGSLAELDKHNLSERMTRGRDRVAKTGRWTGGPIPFGYDLDSEGRLTPSTRFIASLEMTEAELAREVFVRLAEGSTAIAEANRLNALNVPTARRYGGGKVVTVGAQWFPSRIHYMIKNTVYRGEHVFKSKNGTLTRAVPALIDAETFERAQAQIARNTSLPKGKQTRTYLLRGLITCGTCDTTYIGTPGSHKRTDGTKFHYYRCGGQVTPMNMSKRCHAKILRAEWIEQLVWEECRQFILNPHEALAEAQKHLHTRMGHSARMETERTRLSRELGAKAGERERVLTLFRRGRIVLQDAEKELDAIAQEEATIRQHLAAIEAQQHIADAYETHYTEASILLATLQARLADIEAANDVQTKRQVIELLVAGLRVVSQGDGRHKTATLTVTYRFPSNNVVHFNTASCTVRPSPSQAHASYAGAP